MHVHIRRNAALSLVLLVQLALVGQATAQNKAQRTNTRAGIEQTHPTTQILDINNSTIWIRNDGMFPWVDPHSGENGSFPKGTANVVFAQGFLWGGLVQDGREPVLRVNGSTYQTGLDPGRVLRDANGRVTGPDDRTDRAKYHVWRVVRKWKDLGCLPARDYVNNEECAQFLRHGVWQFFGTDPNSASPAQMDDIADQYEYDWNNWPADWGAPYEDVDGNGRYDPAVDIPGYPGASQTLWRVMNDLRPGTAEGSYGSPAIGVENQTTVWGYEFTGDAPLGNIGFIQSRLIYTGLPDTPPDARIDDMYAVWWSDPDVGDFSTDFSGADTLLGLGYTYNSLTRDAVYDQFGLAPPAVGWDFLQGPITAEGDTLGMTSFVYFAAGSDISDPTLSQYSGSLQWYNLMRGLRPRPEYPAGDPFIDPFTGEATLFALTGDPVTGQGWIDGIQLPAGDRRMVQSTGPFTMALGDTVDVVVGQIAAVGTSNLSSVNLLKYYDLFAQFAYDQNFDLPSPPPTPTVSVSELENEIVLNWGVDHRVVSQLETFSSKGFEFEGYNVYQLPSRTASLREGVKIATFDKVNLVSTIFDNAFDEQTGFVIQRPVQISPNEGLRRHISIKDDRIRSRPLANGVEYYFAVTAYSFLDTEEPVPFRMMESPVNVLAVTPQPPRPGTSNFTDSGSEFEVVHAAGGGDATVVATVADPGRLVDATFAITFNDADQTWNLLKNGQPELTNQPFGGDPEIPLVDGLHVNVMDVTFATPEGILEHFAVEGGDDLVFWGDATLFGAPTGFYVEFTGLDYPQTEDAILDLEFRFTGNGGMESPTTEGGQIATYWERAAFGADDVSELDHANIRFPFELWDVENNRQISFAVIGRNVDEASPWGNGVGTYYRMSARDYIVPVNRDYDPSATVSPNDPRATWLLFFLDGGRSEWAEGDVYRVRFANPVVAGVDRYEFTTSAIVTGDPELIRAAVSEINVFPNPYMGFSALEANRGQKLMTFTHLPNTATIRIFALNGTMVRRIDHDSDTQFRQWDLTNQDGIPVASGIYIAHVSTDQGEKVIKMAIVQEEQVLPRY